MDSVLRPLHTVMERLTVMGMVRGRDIRIAWWTKCRECERLDRFSVARPITGHIQGLGPQLNRGRTDRTVS